MSEQEDDLMSMNYNIDPNDVDVAEIQEWCDALESVLQEEGQERAHVIVQQLLAYAKQRGVAIPSGATTPYLNSLQLAQQPDYPGDVRLEKRISALIRWNAMAMVLRAGKKAPELGGHIASYASAATLYDVGFNHFFHAKNDDHGGDLVFIQGHCSPGIYARAFLEGRLQASDLEQFRQEAASPGLSSYPHPWLMPNFWQFATVSMGLGPLQAIYQARFLKYLENRGLAKTRQRKVWCFCGDGEMDEPESLGALHIAAKEGLDNLIIVVNCNLQRLDGPVRGNSKVIQELEGIFQGAGWRAIKVIWGHHWDELLAKDEQGVLKRRMEEAIDGDYQNYKAKDGAYVREHFFGQDAELKAMVDHLSDEEIWRLNRGGHDPVKVYAAYAAAVAHTGSPVVILAKTVKGYGMGAAGEALNTTHQQKKMGPDDLKSFKDRFHIPIDDDQIAAAPFYRPDVKSPEIQYLKKQRAALGGALPARTVSQEVLTIPELTKIFKTQLDSTGEREISTTMVFVRILSSLLKDKKLCERIVPIIPDECRTFGMEGLFRQLGIYSPVGQLYQPVDADQLLYYREDKQGQVLQEGITEAGAFASWMAAATSYANNHLPMIPFFIFYSMFGFQRVGDLAWAAGDMQARGFIMGATSGRTTLAGEGLQHQDGHSHVLASTIPNCICYDPCFSYELAVIVQDGLRRMYQQQENIFYYITLMNENYVHPAMPEGQEQGILKGMYRVQSSSSQQQARVQLLGAGTILRNVLQASRDLEAHFNVSSDVWSVTSFNELRKEGLATLRWNRLHPESKAQQPYVTQCLLDAEGPVIAATDYMRLYADQIREFIPHNYHVLGTDGFGRSDTRAALRSFFEVDCGHIVVTALHALALANKVEQSVVTKAIKYYKLDPDKPNPVTL